MPKLTPFPQQSHFAIFLHLPFMIHTRISSRYNSLAKSAKKSKGFSKINPEMKIVILNAKGSESLPTHYFFTKKRATLAPRPFCKVCIYR